MTSLRTMITSVLFILFALGGVTCGVGRRDEGEERERIKRLEHGSNLVRITGCSIETPAKAAP